MEKAEYDLMYRIETRYWWYVARRWLMIRLLGRSLRSGGLKGLDVGCGTGGNIMATRKFGEMSGCDIAPEAVEFCRERGIAAVIQDQPDALPFPDSSFDFLTSFDVLEHIGNDAKMLADFARVLKPGGLALITVPAYPSLWSLHDDSMHHIRRYTWKEVVEKVRSAGFHPEMVTHINLFLLPLILPVRWLRDKFTRKKGVTSDFNLNLPGWMNFIYKVIFCAEWYWLRFVPIPAGLSLVCVMRKKP